MCRGIIRTELALLHIASSSGEEADEGDDDAILNEAMQVRFHLHNKDCTAHD
jgi:hypothetical protein